MIIKNNTDLKEFIEYVPYNPIYCKYTLGMSEKYFPETLEDLDKENVKILLRPFSSFLTVKDTHTYAIKYIYDNFNLPKSFLRFAKIENTYLGIEVTDEENLYKFRINLDYSVEQFPEEYNAANMISLYSRIDWLRENHFDYKNLIRYGKALNINYKNNLI